MPRVFRASTSVCAPGPQPMSRMRGSAGRPRSSRNARSVDASSPGPSRGRSAWSSKNIVLLILAEGAFDTRRGAQRMDGLVERELKLQPPCTFWLARLPPPPHHHLVSALAVLTPHPPFLHTGGLPAP